jgi:hypothetical protein
LKIRAAHGYEGEVLYFLDSKNEVIGLLKKKTTWYIIIRAIREKLRNYMSKNSTLNVLDLKERISKRISVIQNWIKFSDKECAEWRNLAQSFAEWFDQGFKRNMITIKEFGSMYPVIW